MNSFPSFTPLIQSSEMDTVMGESDHINGSLPNGFMDPRIFDQDNENPETSAEGSQYGSQDSSDAIREPYQPRTHQLPTGCCYDDRMKLHANADFTNNPHHPEDPRRIEAIMHAFRQAGLIYSGPESELAAILKENPTKFMYRIPARKAEKDEICLAHTAMHYEWVKDLGNKTSAELRDMTFAMDSGRKSLYVGNLTYEAALISAGGAIETCKNVVAGRLKNAIAVIRPPGHHAERDESMGFCVFNNVPIAAKVCMQDYPEVCRKVLILDWDVHHGNGIQNMFYDDPNVLYISLHVYQNGEFYPNIPAEGIPDGNIDKVGHGAGIGKNVNIGWHDQGMGDGEYMAAFQRIVMPIAQEFNPEFVIISAGFDAAAGDDLGGCFVTPACYSHMTHMLMSLANGKVAVCLEGGYSLQAISRSALSVAKTLMGEPPEKIIIPPINHSAEHVLQNVRMQHAPYWDCMRGPPSTPLITKMQARGDARADVVMRGYQRQQLQIFKMVSLYIQRDVLSRVFENLVLVTPDIYNAKKIALIIHDPPELIGVPDPVTQKFDSTNTYFNDPVQPYIKKFIALGYGVIDVNIPSSLSPSLATSPPPAHFAPHASEPEIMTRDLLNYLWDNYLEGYASNTIVLLGVGEASIGVKQLLTNRDCKHKIACILSFISGGSLRAVKSEADPQLSSWYRDNSRIYVAPNHACWFDEVSAKRVRKLRFGSVECSAVSGLGEMLEYYFDAGIKYVNGKVAEQLESGGDETEDEDELSQPAVTEFRTRLH